MSLSPERHRNGSDPRHNKKKHANNHKQLSQHAETRVKTLSKAETRGKQQLRTNSFTDEHTAVQTKSEAKKHNTANAHAKATPAAEDSHGNTKTKTYAIATTDDNLPNTKTQTHSDGKTTKPAIHAKTSTHGSVDKKNSHKSESNKHNRIKHIASSIDKESDTEKHDDVATADIDNL